MKTCILAFLLVSAPPFTSIREVSKLTINLSQGSNTMAHRFVISQDSPVLGPALASGKVALWRMNHWRWIQTSSIGEKEVESRRAEPEPRAEPGISDSCYGGAKPAPHIRRQSRDQHESVDF